MPRLKIGFTSLCLALLLLVSRISHAAESDSGKDYPWFHPPTWCAQLPASQRHPAPCSVWSSDYEVLQHITELWKAENWPLLERAMGELASADEQIGQETSQAEALYSAVRRMLTWRPPDPGVPAKIARWRAAMPAAVFPSFVEAHYDYLVAWSYRGNGYASTVTPESSELFAERLRKALDLLAHAPRVMQDTPVAQELLLCIEQDAGRPASTLDATLNQAAERWPWYLRIYDVRLSRLQPKWGGSWEAVDAAIRTWSARMEPSRGKGTYAMFYLRMLDQNVDLARTRMEWSTMRSSLDALVQQKPTNMIYANVYASLACSFRDRDAFANAMRGLQGERLQDVLWLEGSGREACMRWAGL